MTSSTELSFWENRYQENNTPWDLGKSVPAFVSLLSSPQAPKPSSAAVLGCGSGHDAILFAEYGFKVTGFDFAPTAIALAKKRAEERNISVEFKQRNIFALAQEYENQFDYVIEHTCFCAIQPEQRQNYVEVVKNILKPTGELIGLFWAHSRPGGPPFGISLEELRSLFSPYFEIKSLNLVDNSIGSRQQEEYLGRFKLLR
jgi:SAM-dependent methyltransferase